MDPKRGKMKKLPREEKVGPQRTLRGPKKEQMGPKRKVTEDSEEIPAKRPVSVTDCIVQPEDRSVI